MEENDGEYSSVSDNIEYGPSDIDSSKLDFSQIEHYKTNVVLWSLYDLANTIYSMGVVSLVILPFISIVAIASAAGIDPSTIITNPETVSDEAFNQGINRANFLYSTVVFVGNLITAAISPVIGAYADQLQKRKYLLSVMTLFCLVFIYSISQQLTLWWILITFLLANLAYQTSLVVYDSMIPFIARPDDVSKISGFGVAFGYLGSFVAIGIAEFLGRGGLSFKLYDDTNLIQLGYIPAYIPLVAFSFLLFGIPILFTKEARFERPVRDFKTIIKGTISSLKETGKEIFSYHDTKYFMMGWLLFVDTANTVIAFMAIFVTVGLGLSENMILIVLGIGIAGAVIFTYPIGMLGDKIGPKKLFNFIGSLWLISLILGVFTNLQIFGITTPIWMAFIMATVVGGALGGTWVSQRQMLSQLAPKKRTSNYFGFANIFGKISSAIGPYVWTGSVFILITLGFSASMSTRLTILILIVLLIIGLWLINQVEDRHQAYLDGARHLGDGVWSDPDNAKP